MIYFEPLSGVSLILQRTPPEITGLIGFQPSVISDGTAATDQLISSESVQSFMQSQWRMAAANMAGVGAITAGWA